MDKRIVTIQIHHEADGRFLAEVMGMDLFGGTMAYGNTAKEAHRNVVWIFYGALSDMITHKELDPNFDLECQFQRDDL